MIDLDGMDEEALDAVFLELFFNQRYPAFAGSRVRSEGGWGQINVPQLFGPMYKGQRVACVGAEYRVIGMDLGNDCCSHFVHGKIITGAHDLCFQGVPLVMVGSRGKHTGGCGTGTVVVTEGWRKIESPGETVSFFEF